jgi:membrane associated rhomboid family serine protease
VARVERRLTQFLPSPTLETLLLILWVYILQLGAASIGVGPDSFVLRLPVLARPWTLFTTVYAHGGPLHLLTNLFLLLPVGLLVERFTTRVGFHAFFYVSGLLAAAAVVIVGAVVGLPVSAIGASGGVFALVGYAATGAPRPGRSVDTQDRHRRRPRRGSFLLFGLALVVIPLAFGTGLLVALGHATGFSIGLIGGSFGWINATRSETEV